MTNTPPTPKEFWSGVWQEGQIRFHQPQYNPLMVDFFSDIDLNDKTVLVPLAGKTRDILYFLEKGATVWAIEFYEGAILDFFKENNLSFTKQGPFYTGEKIHFFAGDFFDFKTSRPFDVMYDRASQVVFSPENRHSYYAHMATLIHPRTLIFSGAIDHSGPSDYGPPFKIAPDEVKSYYEKMGITLTMAASKVDPSNERMQAVGVERVQTYFLSNKI